VITKKIFNTVLKRKKNSEIKLGMYLGLSPISGNLFVIKFRNISRKVFTVFKSVLKMAKLPEIVAPCAGSNPGTLEQGGLTLSPEPIRQLNLEKSCLTLLIYYY
jgi:hypothetical protein